MLRCVIRPWESNGSIFDNDHNGGGGGGGGGGDRLPRDTNRLTHGGNTSVNTTTTATAGTYEGHTLSTHSLKTLLTHPLQHTLSTHPLKKAFLTYPLQHTL